MTREQQLAEQVLLVPDAVRGHIDTILAGHRLEIEEIARLEMSALLFPVSFMFGWFGKHMNDTYGTQFVHSVRGHVVQNLTMRLRLLPPHLAFPRDNERKTFCQLMSRRGISWDPEFLDDANCHEGHDWDTFIGVRAVTLLSEGKARPENEHALDEWLSFSFANSVVNDPTAARAGKLAQLVRPMVSVLLYETLRALKYHGLLPPA